MTNLSTIRPSSAKARSAAALAILVLLAAPLAAGPADARAGGGFSFGSRGGRTFSPPAFTPTAPRYAEPFQRTETPSLANAQPRRFGGFGGGLMAGLLGAGLFGLFTGGGFFGGIAALFGLLFKLALFGGLIWLVLRLVRGRSRPVLAGGPTTFTGPAQGLPGGVGRSPPRGPAAPLAPGDYQAFERALIDVQSAFSREDAAALSRLATPEMVRGLMADLAANRGRGVRNDVSGVRLLQGDLSEAWQEGATTYATVAMRFGAVDVMVDRASGRVVSGQPGQPVEATELWTFRRDGGGPWIVAAIQQAG